MRHTVRLLAVLALAGCQEQLPSGPIGSADTGQQFQKKSVGRISTDPGTLVGDAGRALTPASIVDALGAATPTTQFSVFGSGGVSVISFQFVGPEFILTEPTVITEIGGFLNNCKSIVSGIPQCPGTLPFTVQIRPSTGGVPDASTVLASFVLSHDDDPLVTSYESVAINLSLEAGRYFALFAPQGSDEGFLLNSASIPFNYQAGLINMGFFSAATGNSSASFQFGAVRILGTPLTLLVVIDIKPGNGPNAINPKSRGMIPVAILTTNAFDATTVNPTTVRFGAAGTEAAMAHSALEDVDGDGDADMILQFKTQDTGILCGVTSGSLKGETSSGQAIEGLDSIKTVGC